MKHIDRQADGFHAGCSALSWTCQDGRHLLGRNFDFSRVSEGTMVTFVPRATRYDTCVPEPGEQPDPGCRRTAVYACLGTGLLLTPHTPLLYEGINEAGLMGGQLYYRQFAHYEGQCRPQTLPLQPPCAVYHLLAQCASVEAVVKALEQDVTLIAKPLMGTVPPLHWAFSDRSGEMIIVEPDEDGLHIYRNTMGVMTNSPGYPWHRLNLLNYAGIRDLDHDLLELNGQQIPQCFSGSGAQGLPGDWSSPSRFVRLAFLKHYAQAGKTEEAGVANLLRLLQSAAFPLGIVRVSQQGHLTELDTHVSPFDYTAYTSVMCAESLRFYWTTYENQRVRFVDLNHLAARSTPLQFPLGQKPDFLCLSRG